MSDAAEKAIEESRQTGETVRITYSRSAHDALCLRSIEFDENENDVFVGKDWRVEIIRPKPGEIVYA